MTFILAYYHQAVSLMQHLARLHRRPHLSWRTTDDGRRHYVVDTDR